MLTLHDKSFGKTLYANCTWIPTRVWMLTIGLLIVPDKMNTVYVIFTIDWSLALWNEKLFLRSPKQIYWRINYDQYFVRSLHIWVKRTNGWPWSPPILPTKRKENSARSTTRPRSLFHVRWDDCLCHKFWFRWGKWELEVQVRWVKNEGRTTHVEWWKFMYRWLSLANTHTQTHTHTCTNTHKNWLPAIKRTGKLKVQQRNITLKVIGFSSTRCVSHY